MKRKRTVLGYVLAGLVPYTEPNLKLAFAPKRFFAEISQITRSQKRTVASTFSRAKRLGLIELVNGKPYLTEAGKAKLDLQLPDLIEGAQMLIVIFDIPEERKTVREQFRNYLKQLGYVQIQKSVWASDKDSLALVKEAISELSIGQHVRILRGEAIYPASFSTE